MWCSGLNKVLLEVDQLEDDEAPALSVLVLNKYLVLEGGKRAKKSCTKHPCFKISARK